MVKFRLGRGGRGAVMSGGGGGAVITPHERNVVLYVNILSYLYELKVLYYI